MSSEPEFAQEPTDTSTAIQGQDLPDASTSIQGQDLPDESTAHLDLPDTSTAHLDLSDGWGCWRPFALRGAGFSVEQVLCFADPVVLAALEAYLAKEADMRAACTQLIASWSNNKDPNERATVRKHLKRAHRILETLSLGAIHTEVTQAPLDSLFAAWQAMATAEAAFVEARTIWEEAFAAGLRREHALLQTTVAAGDLMRAVLWQNRDAAIHGVALIASLDANEQNKRARQARLVAHRYLQRYCTKNDTIGFFGPVGWGVWSAEGTCFEPATKRMKTQGVYFEPWAMAVFARQWSESPAFLLDIPPRVHPLCALVEGRLLGVPGARGRDKSRTLTAKEYAMMVRCDGLHCARAILADLTGLQPHTELPVTDAMGLQSHAESPVTDAAGIQSQTEPHLTDATSLFEGWEDAYQVLCDLVRKGWLIWSLDMTFSSRPEQRLLDVIGCLEDPAIRSACWEQIKPVMEAFEALSAATEDTEALSVGLARLEASFAAQSGEPATRNQGATYAGRTLTYLDGQREGTLCLSDALLGRIAEPLSLILQSARWYTWQIATAYQAHLRGICEQILSTEGGDDVPLVRLWQEASDWLDPFCPKIVEKVVEDLQRRWCAILGLSEEEGASLHLRSVEEVKDAVMAEFAAPHAGWPCARHHAPDLMFAASDLAALERGEGLFVLGELHAGINPLCTLSMTTQHPDLSSLQALYTRDLPHVGIAPIPDVDFARSCHDSRLAPNDLHLDMGAPWASWRGPAQVVPIGSFGVRPCGEGLEVSTRDGKYRFDIVQIIERSLKLRAAVHFSYLPSWAHRPRVQLGALVIGRESWRFGAEELTFARESQQSDRFVGAYRWAKHAELPRFVFARSPKETKPIYVDLHSPPSVEIFCHLIRQAEEAAIQISEMLPRPEEAWLADAAGRHYVSEIRMIAVDPQAWRPHL